jgi:hypothetical protein
MARPVVNPPVPLTEPTLPISDLSGFLDEVQSLFDNIVYYWDQLLFKRNIRQRLRDAWNELRQRFDNVRRSIGLPTYTEQLRDAGLDGQQLMLKLEALSDVWRRFHDRGLSSLLQNVLEWITACLDSLAKVFPQLEAVKEFANAITLLISQNERLTGHEAAQPATS